jgi:3-oxoacyl-[acyl-carrier protein] reductase
MAPRATIILADRDGDAVQAAATELRRPGHTVLSYSVDVTRSGSVATLFSELGRDVGPIHSMFYGAGDYALKPIDAVTEDDWDTTIATHVKGAYLCAKAVLPQMCERCAGAIVTMASDYAVAGFSDNVAYAAAQTALYAFTKSLAQAYAGNGIRVNAVGLGAIDSEFLRDGKSQSEWERFKSARAQNVPMRRLGQAGEIAAVTDFLLSERSSYLTGQIVHVNGGELIW